MSELIYPEYDTTSPLELHKICRRFLQIICEYTAVKANPDQVVESYHRLVYILELLISEGFIGYHPTLAEVRKFGDLEMWGGIDYAIRALRLINDMEPVSDPPKTLGRLK